jgi:hypothetical protein
VVIIFIDNQRELWYFYCIAAGHDKAKPFVRRGRKATGLEKKTAGLPKDDVFGLLGFLIGMLYLLITVY